MLIAKFDENMKVDTKIERDGLRFFDPNLPPFRMYGVKKYPDKYYRMPDEVAKTVNSGVQALSPCTAGGRIRFVTDSPYVAVWVRLPNVLRMDHMTNIGIHGLDMYVDGVYTKSFRPGNAAEEGYESVADFCGSTDRLISINMPLYNGVTQILIGLHEDATVKIAPDYGLESPIVYYGSSITQGGCASRPGMSYQAILERRLDCNYLNLGFSGSARGERTMAEYIANLKDMSIFVYDYDHNAPTPEHLEQTHETMFKIIREAHPDMPILLLSRPHKRLDEDTLRRQEIIKRTYDNARQNGDGNVWFIPGNELMRDEIGLDGTVDDSHPTDLGFFSMATRIEPVLREMISRVKEKGIC